MSRGIKTTIAVLAVMVVVGLITLPSLRRAIQRISRNPKTEEQERRDVMQVPVSTPTDANVQAKMYWISQASPSYLEATTIEIPLSAEPVERAKQLLNALITKAPAPEVRTLPADATLLAFYLQPDGTAIADFSDELSSGTPSGILSEELAVDSITQTLAANATGIQQLKILIHGQDPESLAGHLDLSSLFSVSLPVPAGAPAAQATPVSEPPAATGSGSPKSAGPSSPIPPPVTKTAN